MKLTQDAQYLLDRYMLAFSRRLPLRQRKEVAEELRASLLDEIEARCGTDEIPEEQVRSLLAEFGAPGRLASSYAKEQFLIGPRVFPLFRMVLFIVMIVVSAVGIINIGISLSSWDFVGILQDLLGLIASLMTALGFMVVAFHIVERTASKTDWNEELYDGWKVEDLPEIETRAPVKLWEQVIAIAGSLILILGLNLFGERIGGCRTVGETCILIPVLKDGFFALLPFLSLRWGLSIVLAVLLIWKRRELPGHSIFAIILSCLDIAIGIVFLRGGVDTFFALDDLAGTPLEPVLGVFRIMFYGLIIFLMVMTIIEIVKKIIELFKFPVTE